MKGRIGGHPVTGRLIIIGVLDILIAVIAIILQSAITVLSDDFLPLPIGFPLRFVNNDMIRLGLASPGIWTGIFLLITGIVGIVGAVRRRQIPAGSSTVRSRYTGVLRAFLCLTILSVILSIVLICIAGVLSGYWLDYLLNPPVLHPDVKGKAVAVASLNLALILFGLIALVINCFGCSFAWKAIKESKFTGAISYRSEPLNGTSNPGFGTSRTYKTVEVVTRPASQVANATTTVHDTGSQLSTPSLPHIVSRNPSFNNAIQHKTLSRNHSFNSAVLRSPDQSSVGWSYDF
ncbi:hypothetical protein RvY_15488-2 [Ramazzottius varieornatus]|nr:hypothetical protein RvY_15488-2 [Ramazzottius varieornatus]